MEHKNHHIVGYITQMWVWIALLILTVLTVSSVLIDLKNFVVFAALLIASIKAFIVLSYFMHLKFDNKLLSIMLGLALLVFVSFILLTFLDYSFR
jgi:cytochrome c oxidase subunit 4